MSLFDSIMEKSQERELGLLKSRISKVNDCVKASKDCFDELMSLFQSYKKTNDCDFLLQAVKNDFKYSPKTSPRRSSTKENQTPNVQETITRPKRSAFKEANKNLGASNLPLNKKQMKEVDTPPITKTSIQIKKEKISDVLRPPLPEPETIENKKVEVKTEAEEMPAPKVPAPRKKKIKTEPTEAPKRSTRTRGKKVIKEEITAASGLNEKRSKRTRKKDTMSSTDSSSSTRKDSDVLLDTPPISTIVLSDSESDIEKPAKIKKRPKRTKRGRKQSSDEESVETEESTKKRSKSDEKNKKKTQSFNKTDQTEYEDAISNIDNDQQVPINNPNATYVMPSDATFVSAVNSTFIATSPMNKKMNLPQVMNETVVIEKNVKKQNKVDNNDLMTDDESQEETVASPQKAKGKSKAKPLFSAFEQSPVKKKVAAFEKLGATPDIKTAIPTRVTRTKTKAQAKEKEEAELQHSNENEPLPTTKGIVKEKAKLFTPSSTKSFPKSANSTSKINKFIYQTSVPSNSNSSILSNENSMTVRTLSALKASQMEYIEREKKRKEKETEALRKREALIQAQIDDKKRRREEKQKKAQEHREAMEREMQKKQEATRLKEEKHRQLMAEREERLQKQKEEERKKLLAKKKAMEEKKREEQARAEEIRKKEAESSTNEDQSAAALLNKHRLQQQQQQQQEQQQKKLPIYMAKRAPRLPTPDCYDSDEEGYEPKKNRYPDWCKESELRNMQFCMIAAGNTLKNTFFYITADTPDLQVLFEQIDSRKLKRTSSAIWNKPPRYTMMSLNAFNEKEEDY